MMASSHSLAQALIPLIGNCVFCWLLVALAVLDAEQFWLPDWLTLPGVGLGIAFALLQTWSVSLSGKHAPLVWWASELWSRTLEVLMAAGVVLIIRLSYWLVRRREGMGLGDAKLMAMLGAWLGLIGAVESFAIAVLAASATALVWLIILALRRTASNWTQIPLPLGTFLCLAALSQDFYPDWLWLGWTHIFLR
jgi:leader peptidase (prepilin peptidase)/N-methyltransferase